MWSWDWVDVNDRLPELDLMVLGYSGEAVVMVEYKEWTTDNKPTWLENGWCELEVSHWMPLPGAPESKA